MPGQSSSRNIKVSRAAVDEAFKALSNWGRWGKDDQIGTLNHVTPADLVAAGRLIKRGKTFALGIPLGQAARSAACSASAGTRSTPCSPPAPMRWPASSRGCEYADDAINMPIQSATHWDSLGHIFYEGKMYNGHDAANVDSNGLGVAGHRARQGQAGGPRRAARHRPLQGRRGRCKMATASPTTSSTPAPPRRRWKSARATSAPGADGADGSLQQRGEWAGRCRR